MPLYVRPGSYALCVGALIVALAVIIFVTALLSSRLVQRLAPFVAASSSPIVHAGTGDWNLTIASGGVLLVAAAFVSTTRELVSLLRTDG